MFWMNDYNAVLYETRKKTILSNGPAHYMEKIYKIGEEEKLLPLSDRANPKRDEYIKFLKDHDAAGLPIQSDSTLRMLYTYAISADLVRVVKWGINAEKLTSDEIFAPDVLAIIITDAVTPAVAGRIVRDFYVPRTDSNILAHTIFLGSNQDLRVLQEKVALYKDPTKYALMGD